MRKEDILAFVNRDWAAVERMKRLRWAQSELTPAERLALGDDLRRHAHALFIPTGPRTINAAKISPHTCESRKRFAVPTSTAVVELLRSLAAAMAEQGAPWFLFGAQAAIIYGSPRYSADVDITTTVDPRGGSGLEQEFLERSLKVCDTSSGCSRRRSIKAISYPFSRRRGKT